MDEAHYINALKWVRHIAYMHYFGGAFDPEHMRAISNLAADALNPKAKELPDFEETVAEARARASEQAQLFSDKFLGPGDDDN